jgi:hypothetical protein
VAIAHAHVNPHDMARITVLPEIHGQGLKPGNAPPVSLLTDR